MVVIVSVNSIYSVQLLVDPHSECLATDGFEVRERHKLIIAQSPTAAFALFYRNDLFAKLVLYCGVLCQQLQGPCERVGGRIHARQNHGPCPAQSETCANLRGNRKTYETCAMSSSSGNLSSAAANMFSRTENKSVSSEPRRAGYGFTYVECS